MRSKKKETEMLIDFHAHIFPDAIAARTIALLQERGEAHAYTTGDLKGLLASMSEGGVDYAVILPVMTKPSQFESVNRFAAELCKRSDLCSFGGIHPDCDNIEEKLDTIKSLGLKGVKLHPDYQQTDIDDPRYLRILEGCKKRGLYVSIHTGFDPAFPHRIRCTPEMSARVIRKLHEGEEDPKPFMILAHLGANEQPDETEKHLIGLPVYFDLGVILGKVEKEQLLRVIRAHGADKILFATDTPWHSQKEDRLYFESLPLTEEERKAIAFENARRILGI
jgi:predicted TIM-barrel fold metal-dependent hydrolase